MCCCVALTVQSFSLITGREPVTSLNGLWRFHAGDDPTWSDPWFDDSHWPLIRSDESWTEQGFPAINRYAWYRLEVGVPGNGWPVDPLLTNIVSGYQVYADSKLIGSAGSTVATRDPLFAALATTFRLREGGKSPQTIQIALRVWTYQPAVFSFGAGSSNGNNSEVGAPALLTTRASMLMVERAYHFVTEFAYGLSSGLIGLAILALFLYRRSERSTYGSPFCLWDNAQL